MSKQQVGKLAVFVFLAGMLSPSEVRAWGKEGHVIVAKIAELNLSDKARQEVRKLLGPIPISDSRIANFADFVRHNRDFPQFGKSAPWHFVDIPLEAEGYDPQRDCKGGQCVIDRIAQFQKVLAGNGPADERLEALTFLVHLVGDLHQPLHCTTNNDRGGNDLAVHFLGHTGNHLNLHSVWDSNLVVAALKGLEPLDFANRLNIQIKQADRSAWRVGTPVDWANEAHAVAQRCAYRDAKGDPLPTKGQPNLDEAYVDRGVEQVTLQLQKGGVRLAKVLNDAFGQ
jgi:hypothetical protein